MQGNPLTGATEMVRRIGGKACLECDVPRQVGRPGRHIDRQPFGGSLDLRTHLEAMRFAQLFGGAMPS